MVALALKEKEVLPVLLPKAGGGAAELLVAFPKLNEAWGATGAGAVEFDPAEKLKLLALARLPDEADELRTLLLLLLVLAVPIPPNAKGLFAGAAVDVEPAAAPNENGAGVEDVTLD